MVRFLVGLVITLALAGCGGREFQPTPTAIPRITFAQPVTQPVMQPVSPLSEPDSPLPAPVPTETAVPTNTPTPTGIPTSVPYSDPSVLSDEPYVTVDGRTLKLSIVDAVRIAKEYMADKLDVRVTVFESMGREFISMPMLKRDFLSVWLVRPALPEEHLPNVLVDLESGEATDDLDALHAAEAAMYTDTYGKLQPSLYDKLQTASASQLLGVGIWAMDADGINNQDKANEELGRRFPEAAAALRDSGVAWAVEDPQLERDIRRTYERLLAQETDQDVEPILQWLRSEGIAVRDLTSGMPTLTALMTPEQIRGAAELSSVGTLFYIGGGDLAPEELPLVGTPTPTPTAISASPLYTQRPRGLIGPPGERSTEPVWPLLTIDGRTLWLSQAEGEARALDWVAETQDFAHVDLGVRSVALLHYSGPNRDFLRVEVDHPALVDRWPFEWPFTILVDMQTGAVFDADAEDNPVANSSGSESAYGKYDGALYDALAIANRTTLLPIVVESADSFPTASREKVRALLIARYPQIAERWYAGERIDPALATKLLNERDRLMRAEDAALMDPILEWLQAQEIRYEWGEGGRTVNAWLTPAQAEGIAQLPTVAMLRYVGYPNPNFLPPTPTPFPADWKEIPFETVGAGYNSGWTPDEAGVLVVASADQVVTLQELRPAETVTTVTRLDFAEAAVVVLFHGSRGGACYTNRITRLALDGSRLLVFADFWGPGERGGCAAAVSSPWHMVSVARDALPADPNSLTTEIVVTDRVGGPSWARP